MSAMLAETAPRGVTPVDFRRPSRISREAVVALEGMHDAFARRLATAWSTSTYSVVEMEHVSTDQLSIDDFVRTLPVPTALATMRVDRLDAVAFVQIDLPLALVLVERLLGGPGDPGSQPVARRPTDLESVLLAEELLEPAVHAVDEALRELDGEASELTGLETQPQPLQLGSPGELLLLLTYRVELRGELPGQGLVTLGYHVGPLVSRLDELLANGGQQRAGEHTDAPIAGALLDAPVELCVRLGSSPMPASAVAGLAPGDVLRLDHQADHPAELVLDDRRVGTAHLGRRGRRVAVQIIDPPAVPPPSAPEQARPEAVASAVPA